MQISKLTHPTADVILFHTSEQCYHVEITMIIMTSAYQ